MVQRIQPLGTWVWESKYTGWYLQETDEDSRKVGTSTFRENNGFLKSLRFLVFARVVHGLYTGLIWGLNRVLHGFEEVLIGVIAIPCTLNLNPKPMLGFTQVRGLGSLVPTFSPACSTGGSWAFRDLVFYGLGLSGSGCSRGRAVEVPRDA